MLINGIEMSVERGASVFDESQELGWLTAAIAAAPYAIPLANPFIQNLAPKIPVVGPTIKRLSSKLNSVVGNKSNSPTPTPVKTAPVRRSVRRVSPQTASRGMVAPVSERSITGGAVQTGSKIPVWVYPVGAAGIVGMVLLLSMKNDKKTNDQR